MTRSSKTTAVRGALLAAAALLLATATPVAASPGDWLYLTLTRGGASVDDSRGTLLLCDPPQGHPRAADACAQLRRAGGDIGRIPAKDAICTMQYAPVTVHARGTWDGRPVAYERTFSNGCVLAARTGSVFALEG
ncbi:subtilase-type protease inhibitor [Streptomyces griseus]|uniref:subtilase-type protease inhibitor n=1 Tax=Streptomyces griseus TaxID=1911 RepID=UPI00055FBEC8|nr:subtilase-type protease inhibitor [Streptomyces griseus]